MKTKNDPSTTIAGYYGQQHNNGTPFNGKDYQPSFRRYLDKIVGHALPGYRVPEDVDTVTGTQLAGNDLMVRNYYPINIPLIPPYGTKPVAIHVGLKGATLHANLKDMEIDAILKAAHEAYSDLPKQ